MAKKTLDCLKRNVPEEVTGIAFLSGGQSRDRVKQKSQRNQQNK